MMLKLVEETVHRVVGVRAGVEHQLANAIGAEEVKLFGTVRLCHLEEELVDRTSHRRRERLVHEQKCMVEERQEVRH